MANSVNRKIKGVDSIIQYQMRDQVWSLTVVDKADLIDFDMDDGNNVDITMHSDYRKENSINISQLGGTDKIVLTIVHGANDTEQPSTIILDVQQLNTLLSGYESRIASLESRVTALENA